MDGKSNTSAMPEKRRETIASRVSHDIRAAILRGEIAPGSKINLDRLRETFAISVSPLREAVTRLVADGLVEFEDQRGYRAAPVSSQNLREVTRLRIEMETLALRFAIENASLEWESEVMRALYVLNRTERDSGNSDSLDRWENAHSEFHLQLIRACNMPMLLQFCTVLHNLNDRYRRIYLVGHPLAPDVILEHTAIANAAVARDTTAACLDLRNHIERTGTRLQAKLADDMRLAV